MQIFNLKIKDIVKTPRTFSRDDKTVYVYHVLFEHYRKNQKGEEVVESFVAEYFNEAFNVSDLPIHRYVGDSSFLRGNIYFKASEYDGKYFNNLRLYALEAKI